MPLRMKSPSVYRAFSHALIRGLPHTGQKTAPSGYSVFPHTQQKENLPPFRSPITGRGGRPPSRYTQSPRLPQPGQYGRLSLLRVLHTRQYQPVR